MSKKEQTKEEKIKALQDEIRNIKYKGTFKQAYTKVRKGTIEILKNDGDEEEKKTELINLLTMVMEDLTEAENE